MELVFKSDTKHRKQIFTSVSFSHPAKLVLPLQIWLIENYSKVGDTILDPMGGSGTLLIACTMGRHVILVELENKFVQMQKDNWAKIQTLGAEMGYEMGTATILQGDARQLPDVLYDTIISSPPYESSVSDGKEGPGAKSDKGAWKEGRARKISYTQDEPCKADVVISSPPYAGAKQVLDPTFYAKAKMDMEGRDITKENASGRDGEDSIDNISNLPYGNIDCVITSPPYEEAMSGGGIAKKGHFIDPNLAHRVYSAENMNIEKQRERIKSGKAKMQRADAILNETNISAKGYFEGTYSKEPENIGNLKGDSYLSAMLDVYKGCWRVLKPQGIMCLVTKNFIRNKTEIRLDLDTIKLCEQSGFELIDRHYRKLTSQSFWRTIYQQKYPDAPVLDKEDILVFRRITIMPQEM